MDTMKLETKFMKSFVSKLVSRQIKKHTGYDISLNINGLDVTNVNGTMHAHLSIDAELSQEDLERLLKQFS